MLGALLMAVGKTDKALAHMEKAEEGKQRNKNFMQDGCSEENEVR